MEKADEIECKCICTLEKKCKTKPNCVLRGKQKAEKYYCDTCEKIVTFTHAFIHNIYAI